MKKAIGRCPCAEVLVGSGIRINCLLDTREHLAQENDLVDVGQFISISAANGLDIPYVGYVELDISALGHTYSKLGFLIVKDPQGQMMSTRKQTVPGVIGSNIFRDISHHLEATRGKQFLQTLKHEELGEWGSILALYQEMDGGFRSIDEALAVVKGAKYFCSLDLAHGYNQMDMAEQDIEKTAFRVGTGGLYEYLRMPLGLGNAPATFMRLMDKGFGDQNFLDDILVFGNTFEETMGRLDMVLTRLGKMNLKVKPKKCHMFQKQLRYLGHLVSEEGIAPDPEKIRAVRDWTTPT